MRCPLAIKTFVSRSRPIIDKSKRRSKKSDKTDPRAHWSVARLAQMKQFKKPKNYKNGPEIVDEEENDDLEIRNRGNK